MTIIGKITNSSPTLSSSTFSPFDSLVNGIGGSADTYATISEAVAAGKIAIQLSGSITENADILLISSTTTITFSNGSSLSLADNSFDFDNSQYSLVIDCGKHSSISATGDIIKNLVAGSYFEIIGSQGPVALTMGTDSTLRGGFGTLHLDNTNFVLGDSATPDPKISCDSGSMRMLNCALTGGGDSCDNIISSAGGNYSGISFNGLYATNALLFDGNTNDTVSGLTFNCDDNFIVKLAGKVSNVSSIGSGASSVIITEVASALNNIIANGNVDIQGGACVITNLSAIGDITTSGSNNVCNGLYPSDNTICNGSGNVLQGNFLNLQFVGGNNIAYGDIQGNLDGGSGSLNIVYGKVAGTTTGNVVVMDPKNAPFVKTFTGQTLNDTAKHDLVTPPSGKRFIPLSFELLNPSGTLSTVTITFGSDASCTNFNNAGGPLSLTSTQGLYILPPFGPYTAPAADEVCGYKCGGTPEAKTITIKVVGYFSD